MSDYQGWAVGLLTLLDRIEAVMDSKPVYKTQLMGQPPRTLAERLRDYAHGDEMELSLLSDDAEIAADIFDTLQSLCLGRHDIAKEHGFEVVLGPSQTGEDQ